MYAARSASGGFNCGGASDGVTSGRRISSCSARAPTPCPARGSCRASTRKAGRGSRPGCEPPGGAHASVWMKWTRARRVPLAAAWRAACSSRVAPRAGLAASRTSPATPPPHWSRALLTPASDVSERPKSERAVAPEACSTGPEMPSSERTGGEREAGRPAARFGVPAAKSRSLRFTVSRAGSAHRRTENTLNASKRIEIAQKTPYSNAVKAPDTPTALAAKGAHVLGAASLAPFARDLLDPARFHGLKRR